MRLIFTLISILMLAGVSPAQTYKISPVAGGLFPDGPYALQVSLGSVTALTQDAAGNVYVALGDYNIVEKLDTAGNVTRVAGTGGQGYNGDNIAATSALLNYPAGVVVDKNGNLYIADMGNHRIRKVTQGIITTVVGTGTPGRDGDNLPGTQSRTSYPEGVTVDRSGTLYFSDTANHRVRKVVNGVVTTVAGRGDTNGYYGDGGKPLSALLNYPVGIAIDSHNALYIADSGNHRVRIVSGGVINTFAGTGTSASGSEGVAPTSGGLSYPRGVGLDSGDNLYIADSGNQRIRRIIYGSGLMYTAAGTGTGGYSGDEDQADQAKLSNPRGVIADSAGNFYIADTNNFRLRKVAGGIINTIMGNGYQGYSGEGGNALSAQMWRPEGVVLDSSGAIYIADAANNSVRKISGGIIKVIAGTGTAGFTGDSSAAVNATLSGPTGLALDSSGNLYIADTGNDRIRKVDASGIITTVAGGGTVLGDDSTDYTPTTAMLKGPRGIAFDSSGNMYIADSGQNRIRKIVGTGITTIAGDGTADYYGDNGLAKTAELNSPSAVLLDSAGNVYIADSGNRRIRKITVSTGVIQSVAGAYSWGYPSGLQLDTLWGLARDSAGNLYVADRGSNVIRKVAPDGTASIIAGNGTLGFSGDGGAATSAQLNSPANLAVDASGKIYFTDTGNHRLRLLTPQAASGCSYSLSTENLGVSASGGNVKVTVHTDSGCSWKLSDLPGWVTTSGDASGTGPAEIVLGIGANTGAARSASLSLGGISIPIRQSDSSVCSSCVTQVLPHLAFGSQWTSVLFAMNSGSAAGRFSVSFYGENGAAVALPFSGKGNVSTLSDTVPAGGLNYYEAADPQAGAQSGWGVVTADSSVTLHSMFRRNAANGSFYEAAGPVGQGYSGFLVPFDVTTFVPANTSFLTGFAISNLNPAAPAHVSCVARDQTGREIPNAVSVPVLNPLGHWGNYTFPALQGQRGTLDCTADTLVSAIVFRFIGNNAFSSLPVIPK